MGPYISLGFTPPFHHPTGLQTTAEVTATSAMPGPWPRAVLLAEGYESHWASGGDG